MGTWAVSLVAYLGAVGLAATQQLPRLGITAIVVPMLHLPSGGEWMDSPHTAVAAGVFYFATVAMFKWLYVFVRKTQPGHRQSTKPGVIHVDVFDSMA